MLLHRLQSCAYKHSWPQGPSSRHKFSAILGNIHMYTGMSKIQNESDSKYMLRVNNKLMDMNSHTAA
jgi:hypothetical protein